MSEHSSIVGGSNAGRLLACPGSFQATQALPPSVDVPSEYAEEGSFAHTIMAHLMELRQREPLYSPHHYVLDRMIGHHYYDRVFTRAHYNDMIAGALTTLQELEDAYDGGAYPFRVIGVEQRVKFPNIPGAFGTCDLILTNDKWILHVDWKFGQGVPVKAEYPVEGGTIANPQLMFYTAAAMHTKPKLYKGARGPSLAIAIIQPRTEEPLSHASISRKEVKWFIEDLEGAVIKAVNRDPPRAKGEHCRWAPCKINCPLWTGPMLDLAALDIQPRSEVVSRETTPYAAYLAKAKALADMAAMFKKEVDDQLHAYLEDGGSVPGWRLKAKAKQRKWADPKIVVPALEELGFDSEDIFQMELVPFKTADAAAKRLGVEIPSHLRVAPPTNETTVCATDDPAPPVTRLLAIEQFTAALADLSKSR